MFTQKGLLAFIFICFPVSYIAKYFENRGYVMTGYFGEEYHIFETIASYSFIVGAACIGLFLVSILALGILPAMPGLGTEEKEEDLVFSKAELIEMDREDEAQHNESWRSTSSAGWDGGYDKPVYEDYRGNLRDTFTGEFIHDNHTDKRRVVNGKVSDRYEKQSDGKYKYTR